ncbi:carboxylate-amine ligase [Arthrobacter sp. V4I6]|uniref:glutamate--cysteine ligase 2 n=1 Tax=unclassified Arthrobacter TaxID=235627 RepID=UPI00278A5868|nr:MULTISPECIES: glutamate--cysteine ligase [unclassified Arthrobacter]MDQ0819210.1 carboxylate-amine ligase [Arthrobacter sp. V1I7]MDQ0853394.1 carboxylate-amine ligase [Arthrobacter sp. V4I6]
MRTFGVEEELLIVDPETGLPLALADVMLPVLLPPAPEAGRVVAAQQPVHEDAGFSFELKLEQIETQTRPCLDYNELLRQLRQGRALTDQAARAHGGRVAALATSPRGSATHTTPSPRYVTMQERFGLTVRNQLTCGFHVHTFVESPEEGVAVMDRIRDKLAVLVALSANSPYWNGAETGFESYRTQAWNRWPGSGPTMIFGSLPVYRRVVTRLVESGVLLDEGMIYFDARLCRHHPTVEVRVADVCLRAEDAALIAVLVRALVESAGREWADGVEPAPVPTLLLRMAAWQASNCGLRGELLDFGTFLPAPAAQVVQALVDYLAPVLAEQGELELVREGIARILAEGTGSQLQRQPFKHGGLVAVVDRAVEVTTQGTEPSQRADQTSRGPARRA